MSTITRLPLQAMVGKNTTFDGAGVDVTVVVPTGGSAGSSPSQIATLVVHIESFDADDVAIIQVTDTADNFATDKVAVAVEHIVGGLAAANDRVIRIPWYDMPAARYGVTSAKMRVSVTSISGGTLRYEAWIEY